MLHSNIILFVRQNGHFINSEDLIEIWDQAHYREREENIHRPLNSLMRFRIRKKYVYCWSTSKIFCHGNKIMSLLIFFWFWLIFSSSMSILYFMWCFPVLDVCIFYCQVSTTKKHLSIRRETPAQVARESKGNSEGMVQSAWKQSLPIKTAERRIVWRNRAHRLPSITHNMNLLNCNFVRICSNLYSLIHFS